MPANAQAQLVAEFEGVSKYYSGRAIVDNLSLRIMRGDRLGLIGPNGAGKVDLDPLRPDAGTVRLGSRLNVAYFDQLPCPAGSGCDPCRGHQPGIGLGARSGSERKHIVSYLEDFLFSAQRAKSPISMLSGGERNRLLLARLFAQPANLVVLDEPTNDLDIQSLELLEERLQDYAGTLLLVSHDRRFLDSVVTQPWPPRAMGRGTNTSAATATTCCKGHRHRNVLVVLPGNLRNRLRARLPPVVPRWAPASGLVSRRNANSPLCLRRSRSSNSSRRSSLSR